LAQVQATPEGFRTLDRLNRDPLLGQVPRQEAMDFKNAVMQKRRTLALQARRQKQQQQQQQQQAAAAVPVQVAARLGKLLSGKGVADASLLGVRPGIRYSYAKRFITTRFNYKAGTGGDVFKAFGPTRRASAAYKKAERRDGGIFELETMGDTVGQVQYTEHFTGVIDLNEPRNWLMERYGKPAQFKFTGDGIVMAWKADGFNLVISPANRLRLKYRNPYNSGLRSSLVVTMWTDDYKQYLADAKARCQALRNKPMSELSVQDKMDMMRGCKE
jgi:hypothetical protein